MTRLKEQWAEDCKHWNHRFLRDRRQVYFWVDGIHFNVRLEEERACILVIWWTRGAGA